MPHLPSGTVTFVFSDIEGSTTLLKLLGNQRYAELLATHRRLARETFAAHNGHEIDTQGDAFFYSFARAREAVAAAVAVQRAHHAHSWPEGVSVRVRLGLHTGEPAIGEEGYTGLDVVRASRIGVVGRGGQVLLSDTTRAIVANDLPEGVTLRSLGEQRLRDIDQPEPLHELQIADVLSTPEPIPAAPPSGPGLPADVVDALPEWMRGAASRSGPLIDRASQLIEQCVLAELSRAFDERGEPGAQGRRRARSRRPSRGASVADELSKLQALRDAGALTDEQYARAVDPQQPEHPAGLTRASALRRSIRMKHPWFIDELSHAGQEHIDPAFVAGYDRKQGYPDAAEDLAVFSRHGIGPGSTILDLGSGTRARGAELVGELERYEDSYRLCYVRGPEGIIIELAEQIG